MGLNDPLRISSLISALPTDPDAPRTTAACVLDMTCLSSMCRSCPICSRLDQAPMTIVRNWFEPRNGENQPPQTCNPWACPVPLPCGSGIRSDPLSALDDFMYCCQSE